MLTCLQLDKEAGESAIENKKSLQMPSAQSGKPSTAEENSGGPTPHFTPRAEARQKARHEAGLFISSGDDLLANLRGHPRDSSLNRLHSFRRKVADELTDFGRMCNEALEGLLREFSLDLDGLVESS